MKRTARRLAWPIVLLSPAAALALIFFVAPILLVAVQSLTDSPLIGSGSFIGLANYLALFQDDQFLSALRFGAVFTILSSVVIVVGAYLLAMLVRRSRRLVGVYRGLYLLPFVIGLSTLSYAALLEFRPGYGALNQLLALLHLTDGQTAWLVDPSTAVPAVTLVSAWSAVGFGMILFMTAMQSVPTELIEAARVDGTSWLQRERLVVFPMIQRTLSLVSITTVAGGFLAFTQFFILTQGGPGTSTATPVILAYKIAIQQFRLGYASAMSIVLLLIIAVLTTAQFLIFRTRNDG